MSGYLDWQVGDKVVCVDAKPYPSLGKYTVLPDANQIYTVRRIEPWQWTSGLSGVGVWLTELPRPSAVGGIEHPWGAFRFRKVQPRKTSIAILERFLNDANAPIREEA